MHKDLVTTANWNLSFSFQSLFCRWNWFKVVSQFDLFIRTWYWNNFLFFYSLEKNATMNWILRSTLYKGDVLFLIRLNDKKISGSILLVILSKNYSNEEISLSLYFFSNRLQLICSTDNTTLYISITLIFRI